MSFGRCLHSQLEIRANGLAGPLRVALDPLAATMTYGYESTGPDCAARLFRDEQEVAGSERRSRSGEAVGLGTGRS